MEFMSEKDFNSIVKDIEEAMLDAARKIFSKRVLEEAYNPKNVGEIENPDGYASITGPCGDTMQIYLRVAGNKIANCKFLTDGCGATIACGSVITELVKGKTIDEILEITDKDLLTIMGGLPEEYLHCPVLTVKTLRAAIKNYMNNMNKKTTV
jgi:nitrogen fixation NifU-like protein